MAVTPMTLPPDGLAFLLGKHAEDLGPLKQYREAVVNSFEACLQYRRDHPTDTKYEPEVKVAVDPFYLETTGVRKMMIADNGIGMNPHEIRTYINGFVVSGKTQSYDANFGVGAKIAMAACNPYGVEYRVWQGGEGFIARVERDPETGGYGLYQFKLGEDFFEDVVSTKHISANEQALLKPDFIGNHGVVVVLLGESVNSDTAVAPITSDISHKDYWFAHVMNKQFFSIPGNIKFSAKLESLDSEPQLRVIRGHGFVNDRFAAKSGSVNIGDANAYWWILDDSKKDEIKRQRMWYSSFSGTKHHGHVAVLHDNELFDFIDKYDAIPLLQKFGIVAGHENVIVYVEPKADAKVRMSLTRKSLIYPGGTGIPWKQYANAFYENMPADLREYVSARQELSDKSIQDYVQAQLRKLKKFLFVKGFRPKKDGDLTASLANEKSESSGGSGQSRQSGVRAAEKKQTRKDFTWAFDPDGIRGQGVLIDTTPTFEFVSDENGGFRGRAARFDDDRNNLTINDEFPVYIEHIEYGLELVTPDKHAQARPTIERIVQGVYATHLISAIMTAKASFRNRAQWAGDGFDSLISPEALSTTALARSYVAGDIRRQISSAPALRALLRAKEDEGESDAA